MKIIYTERSFHPNFGSSSHDDINGGIIDVKNMDAAIKQIRIEIINYIKNMCDTDDEDEVNEIINELKPIMPDEERNWGELYDEDNGYHVTYVIIND